MSELKARMKAAREAQSFEPPAETKPEPPAKKRPAKRAAKKRPTKKATEPVTSTATEPAPTANAAAREAAGLENGPSLSRAEYMALRRQTVATLSFEIEPDDKATLMREAQENGRTLRGEVMHRLGFAE